MGQSEYPMTIYLTSLLTKLQAHKRLQLHIETKAAEICDRQLSLPFMAHMYNRCASSHSSFAFPVRPSNSFSIVKWLKNNSQSRNTSKK